MDVLNVNPEHLTYEASYPSPPESHTEQPTKKRKSSQAETSSQPDQARKKRKAWGQPVPEIVPILPPRKRAKTVEEKEQRKNERILRNRRAADKSRQRQKAAVADLERRQIDIEKENSDLKAMLEQYRSKFGDLDGFSFPTVSSIKTEPGLDQSASTPMSMNTDYSHTTLVSTPAITPNSPVLVPDNKALPPLTNNLFPTESTLTNFGLDDMTINGFEEPSVPSGLTQYPAAILCTDLQCQPETPLVSSHSLQFHKFILFLTQLNLHWMIYGTFWTTTLVPLFQIYQILVGSLPSTSTIPIISHILDNHFPSILGLIFPPSQATTATTSRRNVFRMKLLSRLLTCSPKMARLLLAATDRELRAVVDDEGFLGGEHSSGLRSDWAKLMTLKWMIVRLEVEHGRYRRLTDDERVSYVNVDGVDYAGLERSRGRWKGANDGNAEDEVPTESQSEPMQLHTSNVPASSELRVY